ncbi:MAG TPA: DUF2934 domain-containing protein [Candidatus Angelobacter sp.]|nr:DUF2934 domain-containing protein [Candidatus Angelobacter sp.]
MAEKTSETSEKSRKSNSRKKTTSKKVASVTPISQGSLAHETNSSEPNETKSHPAEPMVLEQIRFRAYEIFVERGRLHGFDQEDWARAEAEILAKFHREKSA